MGQLKVAKPKAIVMDLIGTAVKNGFIEKVLMTYIKTNVRQYLTDKWSEKRVKKDIDRLRKETSTDTTGPKIAATDAPEAEQQQTVVDYILSAIESKKESKALSMFRFHLWFDAYDRDLIETPVYSDVAIGVKKWKDEDIKLYVLSNGWVEANKKFLGKTSQGDLNLMLDGVFDSQTEGPLDRAETYTKVVAKIGGTPEEVLLLTKSPAQAKAAMEAGLPSVLVLTHRRAIDNLAEDEKELPRIRSFNELEFE